MERLQAFDIITQRLQHLVDTHEKVMSLYIDDIFKESFLQLQYLQFSIIASDVFEALAFIQANLSESTQSRELEQEGTNLSTRATRLATLAEKVKKSLKDNAGETKFLRIPALTKRQISICKQLYSMESERLVLDWYVKNSTAEFSDLLKAYREWLDDRNGSSIELFD
jgi:hypothetical protein